MKTQLTIEISTKMKKGICAYVDDVRVSSKGKLIPVRERLGSKDIEKSIHDAVRRYLDGFDWESMNEDFNDGGWIEDIEDYEFPEDYCEITIKVKKPK